MITPERNNVETKTSDSVLLTQPDVIPFHGQEAVVRLYVRQKWIAGFCWRIDFIDKTCRMWLDQYVGFGLGHEVAPAYPDECLFGEKDWVIPDSLRSGERPFELVDCVKVPTKHPYPELIVCSFADGTMIMSQRPNDLRKAHDYFKIEPVDKFRIEEPRRL